MLVIGKLLPFLAISLCRQKAADVVTGIFLLPSVPNPETFFGEFGIQGILPQSQSPSFSSVSCKMPGEEMQCSMLHDAPLTDGFFVRCFFFSLPPFRSEKRLHQSEVKWPSSLPLLRQTVWCWSIDYSTAHSYLAKCS